MIIILVIMTLLSAAAFSASRGGHSGVCYRFSSARPSYLIPLLTLPSKASDRRLKEERRKGEGEWARIDGEGERGAGGGGGGERGEEEAEKGERRRREKRKLTRKERKKEEEHEEERGARGEREGRRGCPAGGRAARARGTGVSGGAPPCPRAHH